MIITEFSRDLLMTGAIFGVAAFVWAGWAQERPPEPWIWRVILAALSLCGAALAGITIPAVIRSWNRQTAIEFGGPAFALYIVVFWLEVLVIIGLAFMASRRKRGDLIAPLVLAVVGIHFIPLGWVFMQPILFVAGAATTAVAVFAAFVPDRRAARSFWCGLLGGGILLVIGAVCAAAGFDTLG